MDLIRIFDTTLRDGEQAPGFSMSAPEKIRIARQLESLGVDVLRQVSLSLRVEIWKACVP